MPLRFTGSARASLVAADIAASVSPFTNTYSVFGDGTDDYISTNTNPNTLIGTGDFSVQFSVKPNASGVFIGGVYLGSGTANEDYVVVQRNASNRWQANFRDGVSGNAVLVDNNNTHTAGWWRIGITRTGTTAKLFRNGAKQAEATDAEIGVNLGNMLSIAAFRTTGQHNGWIDEVAIWTSLLSETEMAEIGSLANPLFDLRNNNGDYVSSATLARYWRFEENTGTTSTDLVNGDTATFQADANWDTDVE